MTIKSRKSGNGGMFYRSYTFVDKDPIIDNELRRIKDKEGLTYAQIAWLSGVSATTLYNWFEGPTRRPQNASIEAFARSLGYVRKFEKAKEVNYERELVRAKAEVKK
jgi:transcriptional regulator with XRE-family HTH domain